MLSLLLFIVTSLAYDADNCDCHIMLGTLDGTDGDAGKFCDSLGVCSADELNLDLIDMAPLYLPGLVNAPGIQFSGVIPPKTFTTVGNDALCTVCKDAIQMVEQKLPTIEPKLEAICDRVNSTIKKLVCQKAIKTAVKKIEGLDPEATCEKVHLCNATSTIVIEKIQTPNVDLCSACEKAWGVVQKYDDQIKTALDGLCQKINNTMADKACEFGVNYLSKWVSAHNATVACEDLHLCSSLNGRLLQ